MYADVNVPLSQTDSAFIVPKTAVVTSTEKVFVIRVKDGKAEWVGVQKGLESGDNIEIYGKIDAGDQIVKAATEEIRDGSAIKIGSGDQTGSVKPEKADTSKTKK